MDKRQIAEEVLAAVGGKDNVCANDICMTRLRILTEDPSLVDTEQLSAARGVLGFVRRGSNAIEVVFGPGKVEGVHEELVSLTGIEPVDDLFEDIEGEPETPMLVKITPNPLRDAARFQRDEEDAARAEKQKDSAGGDTVDELVNLLSKVPDAEPAVAPTLDAPARVLVINGPNINMLGIREPAIYGKESYQALLRLCQDSARDAGFTSCSCFQSNHEGDLIDAIQDAYGTYDGIVINPGAYTHTSIAILDAAKAVGLPMVEVHISKVDEREEFRQVSYIRAACFETISGMGIEGYRKAIFDLAEKLDL